LRIDNITDTADINESSISFAVRLSSVQ